MNIEKFIEEHGSVINGQITVSYNTKQTFEQLEEIWSDGGDDPAEITVTDFLEYISGNVTDYIANEYDAGGRIALDTLTFIVNESGSEITE